jgi:hypothetical protein
LASAYAKELISQCEVIESAELEQRTGESPRPRIGEIWVLKLRFIEARCVG